MITPDYAGLMAAYNAWQNESVYAAASTLSDEERQRDRGAFFGSIHKTLSHILWADRIWLSRFGVGDAPPGGIAGSTELYATWSALARARVAFDQTIADWAAALSPADLEGDLVWRSGAARRELSKPRWLLVVHIFNHQAHHRGQVHAMLTAAGAKPADTDIPFMPGAA